MTWPTPSITPPPPNVTPRLAVYKFSSCDGCQLSLLNLEDNLLALVSAVEIAYFLEARRRVLPPPYDVGLVEGSISTSEEEHRIRQVRRDCKFLVAIGACATSGGIQALRNWANLAEYVSTVYPSPQYIHSLETATPIASHVFVDFELRGCPVNPDHLLELISALLVGRKPNIPTHSLCVECKQRGYPCVHGRRRPAMPRPHHPGGMRGAVSRVQPRLLWVFRPDGAAQHAGDGAPIGVAGPFVSRHQATIAVVQRVSRAVQANG